MIKGCVYMGVRAVTIVAACAMLLNCKSQQITTQASGQDSTITRHYYDTIRITAYDTIRITAQQSEMIDEGAVVEFVSEGGTLNLQTGEVGGVKTIRATRIAENNTQTTTEWQSRVERLQVTSDSLRQVIKCYQIAGEKKTNTADIKPQRSSYDRFCSAFFWSCMVAGLIALVWWLTERRFGWWTVLKALLRL